MFYDLLLIVLKQYFSYMHSNKRNSRVKETTLFRRNPELATKVWSMGVRSIFFRIFGNNCFVSFSRWGPNLNIIAQKSWQKWWSVHGSLAYHAFAEREMYGGNWIIETWILIFLFVRLLTHIRRKAQYAYRFRGQLTFPFALSAQGSGMIIKPWGNVWALAPQHRN